MSPQEAADYLNVSVEYVEKLLATNQLLDLSDTAVQCYHLSMVAESARAALELSTLSQELKL